MWPDATAERAAGSLRVALHRIRESLGPHHELIRADRRAIELLRDPAVLLIDTDELGEGADPAAATIGRVVGQELLEGLDIDDAPGFEDWLVGQRLRWRVHLGTLAEGAAKHLIMSNEAEAAIEIAACWVERDPYSEQAAVSLVLARAACDQPDAAAAAWDTWCRTCHDDLRVEPSAGARQRVASLVPRSVGGVPSGEIVPIESAPRRAATPSMGGLRDRPLIGRTEELRALLDTARAAASGQPTVTVVEASMGVGKSRVLSELGTRLQRGDSATTFDVLAGRAHESGGRVAFAMIIDALRRRLERENAPDDLLDDVWLSELSRILPELRVRYPDLSEPPVVEPRLASHRLFETVARLIEALCARAPVALLLDDVHRADASSIDLLAHVVRAGEAADLPLLVVATARPDEGDHALHEWLSGLSGDVRQPTIEIDPLSELEISRLFVDPPQPLVARLHAHTNGNSLFLDGVVRSLVKDGMLTSDAATGLLRVSIAEPFDGELPVPPELMSMLRSQLSGLPTRSRQVVAAAAVLDGDGDLDTLASITRLDEDTVLDEVDVLAAAGLVTGPTPGSGAVVVAHYAIRQAAILEAGSSRRRVLHQRTLDALPDLPAARRAGHAKAAGDFDTALRSWCEAVEESNGSAAWQTAVRHVNAALVLLDRAQPSEPVLLRLIRGAETAQLLAGRPDECAAMLEVVAAYSTQRGLAQAALTARLRHTELRLMPTALHDVEGARNTLEELDADVSAADEIKRAQIDAVRAADIYWTAGDADGLAIADRALPSLVGEELASARLGLLNASIAFGIWEGDQNSVDRRAAEVREGWESLGETWATTRTYFLVNLHRTLMGDLTRADKDVSEGLGRARSTHDSWHRVVLGEIEAQLALERDDAAGALVVAEECAALCADGPLRQLAYAVLPSLVEAHLTLGHFAGALNSIEWFVKLNSSGNAEEPHQSERTLLAITESMPPIAAASLLGAGIAAMLADGDIDRAIEFDLASQHFDLSSRSLIRIDLLIRARTRLAAVRSARGELPQSELEQLRTQLAGASTAARTRGHDLVAWSIDFGLALAQRVDGKEESVALAERLAQKAAKSGWARRQRWATAAASVPLETLGLTEW